jgi:hypothetical protein
MAFSTATTSPINRTGSYTAEPCEKAPGGVRKGWWGHWDVLADAPHDLCLEEGEFALEGPHGCRYIAKATGRTRWFGTWLAATLQVFEIDTVVEMVGELPVIVGRRGEKLPGTWRTNLQAIVAFG